MSQFHLQTHLDNIYKDTEHQYGFKAQNLDEAQDWQGQFREALFNALKISGRDLVVPNVEKLSATDKGTYIEEKHTLHIDDVETPMYVLMPKSDPPYRSVLAFHGHGKLGVHTILGNYQDATIAKTHRDNNDNFAQRLAEDGFLVCAIEQRGFGERVTEQITNPQNGNSCRHLAFSYLLHDRTLLGERVWDAMNAVIYVLSRDDVIADDLCCIGFSGGGTTTLFLSAVDERIKRTVIQGYFCTLKKSILSVEHCECNYVPSLLTFGETGDVAGLIAPRPVRIISGETDPIFPIEGVREQYERLEHIYDVFDAGSNCSMATHPHGHRFDYELVQTWL